MNHKAITGAILAGILLCSSGTVLSAEAETSADMNISQRGADFICGLEGFSAKCYWDYSQSSIGYGTKCTHSSVQPHKSGMHSITKQEAKIAMMSGIENNYAVKVRKQTAGIEMNQNQFDALTSLAYNCGGGQQRIYKSPLAKYLRGELSASEARKQYQNYIVYAGGTYCKGLYNRRVKEANYFFTPVPNIPIPKTASISILGNRTVFDTTEEVIFNMTSDTANLYCLGIDYEGKRLLTPEVADGNVYTHTFDQIGHYTVYISACNEAGYIDSPKIEFEITAPEDCPHSSEISTANQRTIFQTGETVHFDLHSDHADSFIFCEKQNGTVLNTVPVTSENNTGSYEMTLTTPGVYTISGSACLNGHQAESTPLTIEVRDSFLKGDINQDGTVNQNDLQLLQGYLQQKQTFTKAQSEFADSNQDGTVNIFDLLLLKRLLLS